MIKQIVESVVTEWGFDVDSDTIDDFSNAFDSFASIVAGVTVAASAAALAIAYVVDSTAKNIDEQTKASDAFGISTQEYKELTFAAKQAGVEQETLFDVMKDLTKNTYEAANGNETLAATYRELDIDAKEFAKLPMSEKLAVLSDKLAAIPDMGKRSALSMRLMGESGIKMANLMGAGGEEVRKMIAEAALFSPPITKEDEESAALYNDNMLKMTTVSGGFFQTIGTKLIPAVNKFTNKILKFYLANKKVIDSGIDTFANILADGFDSAASAAEWFFEKGREVVDLLGGMENAAFLLGLVFAVLIPGAAIFGLFTFINVIKNAIVVMKLLKLNSIAAQASFFLIPLAIAAVIAILALLATDVEAFLNGQDSFIGRAAKKWPKFGEAIMKIRPFLIELRKYMGFFVEDAVDGLAWLVDGFVNFGAHLETIGNFIVRVFSFVSRSIKKVFFDAIVAILEKLQTAFNTFKEVASKLPGVDKDSFGDLGLNDAIVKLKADSLAQNKAPTTKSGATINAPSTLVINQKAGQDVEDMRKMIQDEQGKNLDRIGRAIASETSPGIK